MSTLANEFEPGDDQAAIREGVRAVVARFGDDYWLARDDDGKFPFEFHRAMADAGWLGITMPEEYGGSGPWVNEAPVLMHARPGPGRRKSPSPGGATNIVLAPPLLVYDPPEPTE